MENDDANWANDHPGRMDVRTLCSEQSLGISQTLREALDWDRVDRFAEFLKEKNEIGGFFSRPDAERILERHVYENLIFLDYVASRRKVSRETRVGDAGSGPGLPGYLFACLRESPVVTLIDSSRRRLSILEDAHGEWAKDGDQRVRFVYGRLEELKETYDIITMRALIPFPFSVEVVSRLQGRGGHLFIAGSEFSEEEKFLRKLGYVSRETFTPPELAFLGRRSILHLEKISKQDSLYPRSWKIIQQDLQKWKESTR